MENLIFLLIGKMLNVVCKRGSEYLVIQLLVYGLKKYIKRSRYYTRARCNI